MKNFITLKEEKSINLLRRHYRLSFSSQKMNVISPHLVCGNFAVFLLFFSHSTKDRISKNKPSSLASKDSFEVQLNGTGSRENQDPFARRSFFSFFSCVLLLPLFVLENDTPCFTG